MVGVLSRALRGRAFPLVSSLYAARARPLSSVTAASIKELRALTGSPMMECKNALKESDGNVDEAVAWLRKRGIMAATKKSSRSASEGVVAILQDAAKTKAIVAEINSETDFAARNEAFHALAGDVAGRCFRCPESEGEDAVRPWRAPMMGTSKIWSSLRSQD